MLAASYGFLEVVKFLACQGANVEARGYHGNTALVYAEKRSHKEVVKFLIDHQTKLQSRDIEGVRE